jgi:hypothetical protein
MPREVAPSTEAFSTTLVKLIPSELVAAYTAVLSLLKTGEPESPFQPLKLPSGKALIEPTLWTVFFVVTILTPLYLNRVQGVESKRQLIFTTTSFVVWAYSLGGIFEYKGWHLPLLGGILLIIWTLLIPLIARPKAPVKSPAGGPV